MTTPHRLAVTDQAVAAWRPRYHITAERNWLNDPNGPIQHNGVYHLFYQANPAGPSWGRMVWGHVSSTDLVRWIRHPPALIPSEDGPDRDGCWSGCARIVDGRPALYYTGIVGDDTTGRTESVCRAWGNEHLTGFTKDPANPLIPGPPPGHDGGYHRDPFLWRDDGGWHLLLADGTLGDDRHGRLLRYDSDDATSWRPGGVFFEGPRHADGLDLGAHWECPALIVEDGRAVVLVSAQTPELERPLMHSLWFAGSIRAGVFEGSLCGKVDAGDVLYAVTSCQDAAGRHLLWGWAQEMTPGGLPGPLPNVGALSLPREVVITAGRPRVRPAEGLEALRTARLAADATGRAFPARAQLELLAEVEGGGAASWTLAGGRPDARVEIALNLDAGELRVAVADPVTGDRTMQATLPARADHRLRTFVDGSLIEVFADDEVALTTRAYPAAGTWADVRFDTSGATRPRRVQAWALAADVLDNPIDAEQEGRS